MGLMAQGGGKHKQWGKGKAGVPVLGKGHVVKVLFEGCHGQESGLELH